jgi:hypothetical protein
LGPHPPLAAAVALPHLARKAQLRRPLRDLRNEVWCMLCAQSLRCRAQEPRFLQVVVASNSLVKMMMPPAAAQPSAAALSQSAEVFNASAAQRCPLPPPVRPSDVHRVGRCAWSPQGRRRRRTQ